MLRSDLAEFPTSPRPFPFFKEDTLFKYPKPDPTAFRPPPPLTMEEELNRLANKIREELIEIQISKA